MSLCPVCRQSVHSHAEDCSFYLKPQERKVIADNLKELFECRCEQKYSIEEHGDGYAIYWGRCEHRHGSNLAYLTECSRKDIIEYFEKALNRELK